LNRLIPVLCFIYSASLGVSALAAETAPPSNAPAPPAEPDAASLIARSIQAHGGWEAYQKLGDMRVEYRFYNPAVDPNAFPTRTATLKLGQATQVRIDYLRGTEPASMGFDGTAAWMTFNGALADESGAFAQAEFSTKTAAWILRLPFVLHGGSYTATREGSAPRAGGPGSWDKVRVQYPDAWQVLYLNHDTGLLERAEWVIPEIGNRTELADFEVIEGAGPLRMFTKLTLRESDGKGAVASDGAMTLKILKREFSVGSTDATYRAPQPGPAATGPHAQSPR